MAFQVQNSYFVFRKTIHGEEMVTKAQKIRVITLITIISVIFLYLMFLLVGKKIFSRNDIYYIKLHKQSVTGLNVGTDVKYYGITIGKVEDITVNIENVVEIIVTISVKAGTPIKETAEANLSYQSIATGLKQIEITGGDNKDRKLSPREFIKSGEDIFDNISGKAEAIAQKIELLLTNLVHVTSRENTNRFMILIDQLEENSRKLDTLLIGANDLLSENKKDVARIIKESSAMVKNLSEASLSAKQALNSFNRKMDSEEFNQIITNLSEITKKINTEELGELTQAITGLVKKSEDTVLLFDNTFLQGRSNILRSIELFKETLENINEFAILIRDNPDILIRGKDNE
jgi:phospholipid/cholesterol/gamma-HCH transport system substrate-binding protein